MWIFFFFQAEDGIRDRDVTGVQTCALPISSICSASASHHVWTGKRAAALSKRILPLTESESGRERKSSTFWRIDLTPLDGQSVPHRTRSAASEIRGRTSRSLFGGMLETSSRTLGCRRRRKNAVSYQRGRPAWQRTMVVSGKSTATSSHASGSA